MKNTALALFFLTFLVSSVSAQFISPVPVVEKEVRDGSSTKLRSMELDRVKREAKKNPTEKLGPASVNNFLEIKEDFEKIQVLENNIVKTYTTGKQIQFAKIAAYSSELNQSAERLKKNLFSSPNQDLRALPEESRKDEKKLPNGLKNLIVELDSKIGAFVGSPIFAADKKAKPEEKDKARSDLEQVIRLSIALKQESEKQTQSKK